MQKCTLIFKAENGIHIWRNCNTCFQCKATGESVSDTGKIADSNEGSEIECIFIGSEYPKPSTIITA